MKYTYNLSDLNFEFGVEKELHAKIDISGVAVTIEFSCEEFAAVANATLAMRNAFIEGVQKIVPVVKEAIIDIGKAGSEEIEKHRLLDDKLSEATSARWMEKHHSEMSKQKAEWQREDDLRDHKK